MEKYKPLLAITMGDAAGSGPEIIAKALADPEVSLVCRPVVIGDGETMRAALKITGTAAGINIIEKPGQARFKKGLLDVIDLRNIEMDKLRRGQVDPMAGKASYEYIKLAVSLALDGECDGIVTSAISKEALNKAGYHYDGHTGLLAHLCGVKHVVMMLVSGKLRISHVTTHVSLSRAIEMIRPERILTTLRITDEAVRQMGIPHPRIAVAGLNPHAGEGGLFGDEESKYIVPAVEEGCRQGMNVTGPLPPDTIFFRALQGEFDAALAMYHDQGHIAFKMLGINEGVNMTLGLPIVRTSVDHGTVFDKAGKGTADPGSLIQAIKLAGLVSRQRRSSVR